MLGQEARLHLLAPHRPRGDDPGHRGEVPAAGVGLEGGEHRPGEGVAHDGQAPHGLALDGVEELDRVEVPALEEHHPAGLRQALDGHEAAGAVHEGAGRQEGQPRARPGQVAPDAVEPAVGVVAAEGAGVEAGEEVVLAPHDALGQAGGAPGVEEVQVVAAAPPPGADPPGGRGGGLLVGVGPVRARPGAVVDEQPTPDFGTRRRSPSTRSVNVPWKTTATASALSQRWTSSSSR